MSYTDYDFPHTHMYDSDLRELIANMRKLEEKMNTFVSINKIEFADPIQWNITTQYEENTIVLDTLGNAYLSKRAIPSGVDILNEEYWLLIFNFAEYVRNYNSNMTYNIERDTDIASKAYNTGDWLLWNDLLYKVTAPIFKNDQFIIGSLGNIARYTVEQFYNDLLSDVQQRMNTMVQLIERYKDEIDTSEAAYKAEVHQDIVDTTRSLQYQLDLAIQGATVDSEVINARVGANDVSYMTLGDAVRGQINNCLSAIKSIENHALRLMLNLADFASNDYFDLADGEGNVVAKIDNMGYIHAHDFDSHKTAYQQILYTLKNYNYAVTDEAGNVVFGIKDNKAIINSKLYGKKVSILGDSISTFSGYIPEGYATYYPHGEVDDVNETWWKQVIDYLGLELLTNASWSGSRVSGDSQGTATCGCSDARIADLKGPDDEIPDIILCFISTNDWRYGVTLGSFDSHDDIPADGVIDNIADGYALMLYKIRQAYPNSIVYCFTELEGRPAPNDNSYPVENANGVTQHEVNHLITEIAHIFGCKIIDLNTTGIHYWNCNNYTVDTMTHPNVVGMKAIKNAVIDNLLQTYNNIE